MDNSSSKKASPGKHKPRRRSPITNSNSQQQVHLVPPGMSNSGDPRNVFMGQPAFPPPMGYQHPSKPRGHVFAPPARGRTRQTVGVVYNGPPGIPYVPVNYGSLPYGMPPQQHPNWSPEWAQALIAPPPNMVEFQSQSSQSIPQIVEAQVAQSSNSENKAKKDKKKRNKKSVAERLENRNEPQQVRILARQEIAASNRSKSPVPDDPRPRTDRSSESSNQDGNKSKSANIRPKREDLNDFVIKDGIDTIWQYHVDMSSHKDEKFKSGCRYVSIYWQQKRNYRLGFVVSIDTSDDKIRDLIFDTVKLFENQSKKRFQPDDRENLSVPSLPYLGSQYIFPLRKKNSRFALAVYFCRICDYHINNLAHCLQHITSNDHVKAKEDRQLTESLKQIPMPSPSHTKAVGNLIESVAKQHGRSMEESLCCAELAELLTEIFDKEIYSGCSVRVYGSCSTGVALKNSNVNLELVHPDTVGHAEALFKAHEILRNHTEEFSSVVKDFADRWPFVQFKATMLKDSTNPDCILSVRNWQAFEISRLLRVYTNLVPIVTVLGQSFRQWAKLCKLDSYITGSLAPYAFDLMLIHYLQQIDKLPILHQLQMIQTADQLQSTSPYQDNPDIIYSSFIAADHEYNLGALWIGLFKFYAVERDNQTLVVQIRQKEMTRDEKGWNKKRIAIEDPFLPNKNVGNLTTKNYDYFIHCFQWSYRYFAIPQLHRGPIFKFESGKLVVNKNLSSANSTPTKNSPEKKISVSGDSVSPVPRELSPMKYYNRSEMLTIEKSVDGKLNIELMKNCGKLGLLRSVKKISGQHEETEKSPAYCLCIQVVDSSSDSKFSHSGSSPIPKTSSKEDQEPVNAENIEKSSSEISQSSSDQKLVRSGSNRRLKVSKMLMKNSPNKDSSSSVCSSCTASASTSSCSETFTCDDCKATRLGGEIDKSSESVDTSGVKSSNRESPEGSMTCSSENVVSSVSQTPEPVDLESIVNDLTDDDYYYLFASKHFFAGKELEVLCNYCGAAGHKSFTCPEKRLPKLKELTELTQNTLLSLNGMLSWVESYRSMTVFRCRKQEEIRKYIEELLSPLFPDGCLLDLFGSSLNGFGFESSDLDLCLRFGDHWNTPTDVDPVKVIKKVAKQLHKNRKYFKDVLPVTSAKVPIVKFNYILSNKVQWEGDISFYNVLALKNTRLLAAYAAFDSRVRTLGITVKEFAKDCWIGDASKGSLSSYAYIIMLIHYLQRCTPPVLPVLQELESALVEKEKFMVDNCFTYFCEDVERWKAWTYHKGGNRRSPAELWVGFLRFYTENFKFDTEVVQIRRMEPLTKFEKLWTEKPMCIEDPFDQNHNLASGLSKKMYSFIRRSLIRGRESFGSEVTMHDFVRYTGPQNAIRPEALAEYYFFYTCPLREDPPTDRLCRLCGRVGHFVEVCPHKKSNRAMMDNLSEDEDKDEVKEEVKDEDEDTLDTRRLKLKNTVPPEIATADLKSQLGIN